MFLTGFTFLLIGACNIHKTTKFTEAILAGNDPIAVKIAYDKVFNEGDLAALAIAQRK